MRRLTLAAALIACAACSDRVQEPLPDSGVSTDTGVADTGADDAGFVDTGPLPDGGIDDSLDGTALASVQLVWAAPLELCAVFQGATALDEALEQKLLVRIAPAPRSTLHRSALESATLGAVEVQRGPLHAERNRYDVVTSKLDAFDVVRAPPDAQLSTSISHDLGDGTTLIERHDVVRSVGGEAFPVEYDSLSNHEVTFALLLDGEPTVNLDLCSALPGLPNERVLSAVGATRSISIVRAGRGFSPSELPNVYHPGSAYVFRSDVSFVEPQEATSYWAQAYAAGEDGTAEHSSIDYARDHAWYFRAFSPNAEPNGFGYAVIRHVEIDQRQSPGTVTLIERAPGTGAESSETLTIVNDWADVGELTLLDEVMGLCNSPETRDFIIWGASGRYRFRLAGCAATNGVGFAPKLIIPLFFSLDPAQVGASVPATAIRDVTVEGQSGFEFDVGARRVQLYGNNGALNGRIYAGANQEDEGFAYEQSDDFFGPQLVHTAGTGDGGNVTLEMTRRVVGQGAGHSAIFAPLHFTIRFADQSHSVQAWDRLAYTNTHHNWSDSLIATSDEVEIRFEVTGYGGEGTVSVTRISDGEQLVGTPVTLMDTWE